MAEKIKVGVVGCGNISDIYLANCAKFEFLEIAACADLILSRAGEKASKFGIPKACTTEELLADPQIDVVLDLTIPKAHAMVNLAALEAGKHVYSEKPLAVTRADGQKTIELATAKGLRVGSAPDTFLGGGLQTCRKLVDEGAIGEPVAATSFMTCHGHESWHPDPEFYYQAGGGPMFDMGPYYLTALVSILGPVSRVSGSARISFPERLITSQPHFGEKIVVETPTHVVGVLDFENGAVGTVITSFDVWAANLPFIEIYGSEGSLSLPDPNTFGGTVRLCTSASREWQTIPLTHGYRENSRGIGVAEMMLSERLGRPHRASGEMAFHVLDIMQAIGEASQTGQHVELASTFTRPSPLPQGLADWTLDGAEQ